MKTKVSFTLICISTLLVLSSCHPDPDWYASLASLLTVSFENTTEKDAVVVYSIHDGSQYSAQKKHLLVESGKTTIQNIWDYWHDFEDSLNEGVASIELELFHENYSACGWKKGEDGMPADKEYDQYGLCYVNHPITKHSVCYTEVSGKVIQCNVHPDYGARGIELAAVIKEKEDGSQYIEWSLMYPKDSE